MARILLVEDDKLFRWALKEALGAAGHEVVQAESCVAAREELCSAIDLALFDYHLPDGTGLGLLDKMKHSGLDYPAIILTAHPTDDEAAQAVSLGALTYVSKPDDPEDVVQLVNSALDGDLRMSL